MSPYLTVAGAVLAGGFLFLAAMVAGRLFAPQAPTTAKLKTYECGVDPVGQWCSHTNVRYFLFAFLYLFFAFASFFLFPFASFILFSDLFISSLAHIVIFICLLLLGLSLSSRPLLLRLLFFPWLC